MELISFNLELKPQQQNRNTQAQSYSSLPGNVAEWKHVNVHMPSQTDTQRKKYDPSSTDMLFFWPASEIFILTRKRKQASLRLTKGCFSRSARQMFTLEASECDKMFVCVYKDNSGIKILFVSVKCWCVFICVCSCSQCTVLAGRTGCHVASVSAGFGPVIVVFFILQCFVSGSSLWETLDNFPLRKPSILSILSYEVWQRATPTGLHT